MLIKFTSSAVTGEALWVTLKVSNTSSRKMRPRFALCDEQTFITHMKTKQETHKIMMKTGKVVKPYKTETVTKMFDIPDNLTPSTLNCTLIELQYWLKVNRAKTLYILTGAIMVGLADTFRGFLFSVIIFSLFQMYTSLHLCSCFFLIIQDFI